MSRIKKLFQKNGQAIIICTALALLFLALGLCKFSGAVGRLLESGRDFGLSCAYYVCEIFEIPHNIVPTVNYFPRIPFFSFSGNSPAPEIPIPNTFEGFSEKWAVYWQVWASGENVAAYFRLLGDFFYYLAKIILILLLVFLLIVMLLRRSLQTANNDYNRDSKPLRVWKWLSAQLYSPVKEWFAELCAFLRARPLIWQVWIALWLFYFNAYTIVLEFIAFYLYFIVSFDFINIYRQVYKLILDLWAVLTFFPLWAWGIGAVLFLMWWRKRIGLARLRHFEMKNRGFINARPIVTMVCGTMGKKKTTAITDMALSQSVMFKDKAFEKILENDLKFPCFPWCNFENALRRVMARHIVYNLATVKTYVRHLRAIFIAAQYYPEWKSCFRRHLKKAFGIVHSDFCFDYDFEKYGLTYNDKLKVVDLWEVLETYAQLYFIYVIQSSLILSNYSIRTDDLLSDLGNFPMWNTDFFKRDSRLMDSYSRHAHILDFDALRLGRKVVAENPQADSFEFGVVVMTEVGKERKNQLELREMKKREESTNQKNDGFNEWLKMIRHSATVDNFPFVKVLTDEQRPESWGADARDLCEIVHIRESGETSLAMPFFALGELFYSLIFGRFADRYYRYRYMRSDNTLGMYLMKSVTAKIHRRYVGIHNTFDVCPLRVQIESGTQDGQLDDNKYYLMSKKIYSKRFSTDCFSDFFMKKALRSPVGLDDLREFETEKASFDEMLQENSYFFNDLIYRDKKEDE